MAEEESSNKPPHVKDLSGHQFGRLTVISFERVIGQRRVAFWSCRCICGNVKTVSARTLKSGHVKSCGCLNRERVRETHMQHGMWATKEYWSWALAKERCRNPNNKGFKNYGGRGITFSEEWDTFEQFFADMGPCPGGMTLDRIDNNTGYSKGNCRWATRSEQMRNTRCTVMFTHNSMTLPLATWAEITGIPQATLRMRHFHGMTPPRIFEPVQTKFGRRKGDK